MPAFRKSLLQARGKAFVFHKAIQKGESPMAVTVPAETKKYIDNSIFSGILQCDFRKRGHPK
jgi:hypothetical protein